ncbi:dol-P-Man:Man(7)GlcNAc(2)-PP-Dol alpha-1,6-mannosyltransferase [Patella vulgata]|uniref:dol-P-Man:Man(7)GlcNAc(2)-PP-Dol alpha-1,6-mannosyltransferase n=1 Tax=Patella vulgata TaxID=6465 RepID=UPI00218038AD|nr:dol-P-Man:Man(7)GlcNAc(2)-PP-Dol alpha-1,6-mannosyltransferase [Patella vulgata]XP_050411947.1 dol-P-Man:Man(7)GlcNAc(2)-PP-Dol alpha-1,6-mannosyltransferase [Patella vulgata]
MVFIEELSIIGVMIVHLLICPYTKVEESFNIQAIHDILFHKLDIEQYDHLEFPGVVPRSFLGPLVISFLSAPMVTLSQNLYLDKFFCQYIVRFWLGMVVAVGFISFTRAVGTKFGKGVKLWLIICSLTQFHFVFYMSRPLPNVFALALVLFALSAWLREQDVLFIWLSGASIIIYRSELFLFLAPLFMTGIILRKFKWLYLAHLIAHSLLAAVILLGLTVLVDSWFWRRWLWPEGEVWWYNIILNKSSNWGTQPFLWYFYSALLRALSVTFVLVPFGALIDRRTRYLIYPAILFIFLYSFLPHKELRFIIYTFPVFNVAIAAALHYLWIKRKKSIMYLFGICLLVGNIMATSGFLYISHHNYPGGHSLYTLHTLENKSDKIKVHIDVFSAQTGITRFTQINNNWVYNKSEDLPPIGPAVNKFTHLLLAATDLDYNNNKLYQSTHTLQSTIHGFAGMSFMPRRFPPISIRIEPKIWILKRNGFS